MNAGPVSRGLRAALLCGAMLAVAAPAAQASMAWDATSYDFGSQNVGASVSKTFTLTATCDASNLPGGLCTTPMSGFHDFGTPTVTGNGFVLVAPNTCSTGSMITNSFPGSATCTSTVTFTPAIAGAHAGSLSTPTGPDIALSGTGVSPTTPAAPAPKKCKKKKGKKGAAAAKKCKKKGKKN